MLVTYFKVFFNLLPVKADVNQEKTKLVYSDSNSESSEHAALNSCRIASVMWLSCKTSCKTSRKHLLISILCSYLVTNKRKVDDS